MLIFYNHERHENKKGLTQRRQAAKFWISIFAPLREIQNREYGVLV
jgi:hypothetical protein